MFVSSFRSLSACNCHSILCVPQTGQPAPYTCDTIAEEDVLGTSSKNGDGDDDDYKSLFIRVNRVTFIANGKRQTRIENFSK